MIPIFFLSANFLTINGTNMTVPERLLINMVIRVNFVMGKIPLGFMESKFVSLVSVNLILTGKD